LVEGRDEVNLFRGLMENPVARVGEGALQGVWDFASPAFAPLARFLHQFAG
jgi:hypothetical protein